MSNLKIAYFVGSMNCGGAETMLMNILEKLDPLKYDITFIVNIDGDGWYDSKIKQLGGTILKIKKLKELGIKKYIEYLKNIFIEEKFTIVHSHTFLHSGFVMKAAKEANVKIRIAHSHSNMNVENSGIKYQLKKIYLRNMILKNATNLLACSYEAGICLYGNKFKKIGTIINNPVRIQEIKKTIENKEKAEQLRKVSNILPNQLVLGHIGRFVDIKNHEFLIQIASKLKREKIDFKLFLIGDGDLKDKIEKKAIELKLMENIVFTGNISNVYEYINIFDLFLLPSFYEGLPLAAVEAQGFGKTCIVSNRITNEIDIVNGKVIHLDITDAELWANQIVLFLHQNEKHEDIDSTQILIDKGYDTDSVIKKFQYIYGG